MRFDNDSLRVAAGFMIVFCVGVLSLANIAKADDSDSICPNVATVSPDLAGTADGEVFTATAYIKCATRYVKEGKYFEVGYAMFFSGLHMLNAAQDWHEQGDDRHALDALEEAGKNTQEAIQDLATSGDPRAPDLVLQARNQRDEINHLRDDWNAHP